MFLLTIALVFLAGSTVGEVVSPCTGIQKLYDAVKIIVGNNECVQSPCRFVRGQNVTALIDFTTQENIEIIKQRVNATALGIQTPFPLPDADKGCNNLDEGHYCPLDPKEKVTYTLVMPVLNAYPLVALSLDFFLLNQVDQLLLCFNVLANVVTN